MISRDGAPMSNPLPLPSQPPIAIEYKLDIQSLWAKYEDIAMHFNDLLMRLRSQGLAGIAAISTLVGIFTKGGASDLQSDWLAATFVFFALALFWIAIFCLDLFYYNKLLIGAVGALLDLEEKSKHSGFDGLNMSTRIAAEFKVRSRLASFGGVLAFYGIVLFAILCGVLFSWHMDSLTSEPDTYSA